MENLILQQQDIMEENKNFEGKFAIALDKGTFDAISLNPVNKKESMDKYIANVSNMLAPNGQLLITSCNWTGDELRNLFQSHFNFIEQLPTPTIKFGGKSGSNVSVLLFRRKTE